MQSSSADPIRLASEVERRYRDYLKTTFYFRDPELRSSFELALDGGPLRKGPYLESTPVFKLGLSPDALFRQLLRYEPEPGLLAALHGERPLYLHQEQAVRRSFCGSNIVAATGTGSGKTESFLYPIILHLYQEFQRGELGPGVRALVLYPMNALANDQRERLGEICGRLREGGARFRFTFGQYIGETPKDAADARREGQNSESNRLPGELVFRSEMQATPPHILLTNYSMLEYLLLRPEDSPLFDEGRAAWWTYLVLDEAHQYRGTRGIEMALLVRRLKRRLREGGRTGPFRCVATSATLMGGDRDISAVAAFATALFGEPFDDDSVIVGVTEPELPTEARWRLPAGSYRELLAGLEAPPAQARECLAAFAESVETKLPADASPAQAVGFLLICDERCVRLRRMISGGPVEVGFLAGELFSDLDPAARREELSMLVLALAAAENPHTGAPLLSPRYHTFLRSLEGAFVRYWPKKEVVLNRRALDEAGVALEVALCRECGQHYFVGQIANNRLREANRDPGDQGFGASFFRPLADPEEISGNGQGLFHLCLRCGEIRAWPLTPNCSHDSYTLVQQQEQREDQEDQMRTCTACGYRAPDPVREVVHGTDGPHAVVATTLHAGLPEGHRKLLAFADGRQEAAFFAWYLENSYRDIQARNLLLSSARGQCAYSPEGLSLQDLACALEEAYRRQRVLPPSASVLETARSAWAALYREFLTDERRICLEGVGLLRWDLQFPEDLHVPVGLLAPPWSLTEAEAHDLLWALIDSLRLDRAVELCFREGVSVAWADLGLQAPQSSCQLGPAQAKNQPSWDGQRGRRVGLLTKVLERRGLTDSEAGPRAIHLLHELWDAITDCDRNYSQRERVLIPTQDGRRSNPAWFRAHALQAGDALYQCLRCGRLQFISVLGVCLRHGCQGTVVRRRLADLEPNHYRTLYESPLPASLRVEEHTAQLDKRKAREFQRDFRDGRIHVLSCSTTFELGVDLGDLDTIFLRNVPPESFNYAQRVGRAGRRRGHVGFAMTYCRRMPHDLSHFAEPDRMLRGKVRPPVLALQNEKIVARHIAATALSWFFRAYPGRFQAVSRLFEDLSSPSGVSDLRAFVLQRRTELEDALRDILPAQMHRQLLEPGDTSWIDLVAGSESRFALAQAVVSDDYRRVVSLEAEAAQSRQYQIAGWARRRAQTIESEDTLSFLSRMAVIPKYGFPVDVVELDTQRAEASSEGSQVLLQRDLSIAIAEFAPTGRLVANKKEWVSYALKRVVGKEWPRRCYKRCPKHNLYCQWERGQLEPALACGDHPVRFGYVVPAFGFLTERDPPHTPKARGARSFTTRPYFVSSHGPVPDSIEIPSTSPVLSLTKASPGDMVVLCEGRKGQGFLICPECGAGFRERPKLHRTAYGQTCHGSLERLSLGHEFTTDVLQLHFYPTSPPGEDPTWFAYSLAYSLVEGGAEVLAVPPTDLSATVRPSGGFGLPSIVLYDNVPGGAALVARLESLPTLREALEIALVRVSGACGCDENASCYGCLRSYRNQFAHSHLKRGPVREYLAALLERLSGV